jgi:hypothetical protein
VFLTQGLFNKLNFPIKNIHAVKTKQKKPSLDLFTAESSNLIETVQKLSEQEAVARKALDCPWERELDSPPYPPPPRPLNY